MVKNSDETRALVPLWHSPSRSLPPSFACSGISAAFIAHLIAIKLDVEAYRVRRRLDPGNAVKAYAAARTVRRCASSAIGGVCI